MRKMCASNPSIAINSRRRACTACQQSKRRCDQQVPRCGRCLSKGLLSCSYPALEAVTSSTVNVDATLSVVGEPPHIGYFVDVFHGVGATGITGPGGTVFQDFFHSTQPHQSTGFTDIFPLISNFENNSWPALFNPDVHPKTQIARESMVYCVAQYRTWPARWVTEAIAPFIHPALYASASSESSRPSSSSSSNLAGLPPVLQDAFSVCAAYAAKNDLNSGLVMSLVETKSTALLYSPDQGHWMGFQQLAALQALILYQMMRLFDGDIRQRALGEAAEPVLASWTSTLQAQVGGNVFDGSDIHMDTFGERQASLSGSDYSGSIDFNLGVPEGDPSRRNTPVNQSTTTVSDSITSSWRQWLFNESMRRTIITSFMIRAIYAMARQGYSHLSSLITDMSFTSCSRLWAATTAGRWKRARETADAGWISCMDFSEMLSSADPRNVDEFAVMMAVTYRGKDAIEDWLLQRRQRNV